MLHGPLACSAMHAASSPSPSKSLVPHSACAAISYELELFLKGFRRCLIISASAGALRTCLAALTAVQLLCWALTLA